MKKLNKIASIVMLAAAVVFAAGCTKPDEPNNGGDDNGGGGETPEVPTIPTGAVDGTFTINEQGGKVYFSQGNLQYQASTQTWRFGNPWDFVGGTYGITGYNPEGEPWPGTIAESNNCDASATYTGWIDLFSWGTSGWAGGVMGYQPYSIVGNPYPHTWAWEYYIVGDNSNNGLVGQYANADWGVYNAISNGGNQAGLWRTLTNVEWAYLFGGGSRSSKWGRATIDGRYKGIILLPDEWTAPDGISFTPAHNGFNTNAYTMEQWECLEAAGAIFLPAAGFRQYTFFNYENQYGVYWSVSPDGAEYPDCALGLLFNDSMLYPSDGEGRSNGFSVRLVQDK